MDVLHAISDTCIIIVKAVTCRIISLLPLYTSPTPHPPQLPVTTVHYRLCY